MIRKIPQALLSRGLDLLNKNLLKPAMQIFELYPEDPACQTHMAEIIYQDEGRPDRESVAFSLYKQAAENGYVDAYFYLAFFYECGIGVEVSLDQAKNWYLKCIDLDAPNGLLRLGHIYLLGKDGKRDWVQAYRYFYLSYVATGSSKALVMMNDALHCMTRSEHEHALSLADDWIEARYKLHIKGLDRSEEEFLQTEGDFGFVIGNCQTSLTFLQTKTILDLIKSKNYDAATELLLPFVDDAFGQFLLGLINYRNEARPTGKADSIPFFYTAAESGCPVAFFRIGHCLAEGVGTTVDVYEAINWYARAALLGDSLAQHNLAQLHYRCADLPRDYVSAYKWYFLSLAHGCKAAERQYIGLISKMSQAEQDEAWAQTMASIEKIYEINEEHRHPDHQRFFHKKIRGQT